MHSKFVGLGGYNSPSQVKGWQPQADGIVIINDFAAILKHKRAKRIKTLGKLPYNHQLKAYSKNLRKAGNLSEVLLWQELKSQKLLELDFIFWTLILNKI